MKIFYTGGYIDTLLTTYHNFLSIDLDIDKWTYVSDLRESDVVAMHGNTNNIEYLEKQYNTLKSLGYTNQLLLLLDIFHLDEHGWHWHFKDIKSFYESKNIHNILYVHNDKNFITDKTLYNDHMFNRQKSYFTEYHKFDKTSKIWSYDARAKCYQLDDIKHDFNSDHIFLSPNRVYHSDHIRNKIRERLRTFLKNTQRKGFISMPDKGIFLEPEESSLLALMKNRDYGGGGTWFPIANKYYQKSYISIYVETLAANRDDILVFVPETYRTITEKTFDPLIKGHFILPLGYSGIIQDIKDYGFLLPDFIDYNYDFIIDNQRRYEAFEREVERLVNIPLSTWSVLYTTNKYILEHNRNVFYKKPYDCLYDSIRSYLVNPINNTV